MPHPVLGDALLDGTMPARPSLANRLGKNTAPGKVTSNRTPVPSMSTLTKRFIFFEFGVPQFWRDVLVQIGGHRSHNDVRSSLRITNLYFCIIREQ
jgi:hypothetical protein